MVMPYFADAVIRARVTPLVGERSIFWQSVSLRARAPAAKLWMASANGRASSNDLAGDERRAIAETLDLAAPAFFVGRPRFLAAGAVLPSSGEEFASSLPFACACCSPTSAILTFRGKRIEISLL